MRHPFALLTLPLLALAGCTTSDTRYPSLLPRPIESQDMAEPERPAAVAAPDAALDGKIAAIVATVDNEAKQFANTAQNAEAVIAVARGVPEGSEAWLNAQIALSEVEASRAPVLAALADLERTAIERGGAGQPPYPALDAAVARTDALANDQAARIAGLEAALSGK